jgi:hypothetical protein
MASSSNSAPGGSQDYGSVRTRNDLALLINQNIIKQEVEAPVEEEGREMDVDEGNEPVLYLGETNPGEGDTDDSFDVEMEELRNRCNPGEQREDGAGSGEEGAGAGEERAGEQQEGGEGEAEAEVDGQGGEQGGEGEENAEQRGPGQEVPEPDPEVVIADPVVIKPRYNPSRQYFAVKEIRASGTPCRPLNRKSNAAGEQDGGFDQEGDERWGRNWNRFDVESGRNVSASFNPITGVCGTCLTGVHPAWRGCGGGAIVLVLSDHHFPANMPVDGPGDCLRIFRVENGSVNEIVDEFLRVGPRDGLAEGTVIMLASASQLGYDSVEHYSNEWKRCRNLLKNRYGGVMVLPGLPLTGTGIYNTTAVRGLVDVAVWFSVLEEHELKFLRNTRKAWEDIYLGKRKRGAGWCDYRLNIRLPVSLKEGGGTTPSFSEGWGDRQEAIPKLNEAGERY